MGDNGQAITDRARHLKQAEVMANALGVYVRRALAFYLQKEHTPGMEDDMRNKLVAAVTHGLGDAIDSATSISITSTGVLVPKFDMETFIAALEQEARG